MSLKRKISVRKIIQALLTIVLTGVCITAVLSATKLQKTRTLSEVDIRIKNKSYGFVTEDEIRQLIVRDNGIELNKTKLSRLKVKQMERVVTGNPWVEDAQVYIDNRQTLHALVTQRVPVVRIFEKGGNSYYIDRNMEPLPLSNKYNYYTTVVTNVPELKADSAGKALKAQIMALVQFIRRDTFWNEQVSQVIVRDDLKFEIVPVLGGHQIIIGDTMDMQLKFDNLFAFYTKVLNEVGWDKYEVLDLSFKGQLVASPAIKWRLPVDKAINRINWVQSIIGEAKKPEVIAKVIAPAAIVPKTEVITKPVPEKELVKTVAQPANTSQPEQPKAEKTEKVPTKQSPEKKREPKQPAKKNEKKEEDKAPKYIYNGG